MPVNMTKHSEALRKLCKEYYFRNITREEFKSRREEIFDNIENEILGKLPADESYDENILNHLKLCIKKLNPIE